jgi:DNA polymerase III subunit delta
MQLAAPQLSHHLERGLKSLYTLHGDEPLLIQEAADTIRATARAQGYTERMVHTVAGAHFDWSEVLASGGSLSLFADKQIVEVRVPTGKPGKEGSPAIQQLAQAAQDNDSMLTLFILPRLDKMTKTGAWFAALESYGVTVQIDSIERRVLPQWIAQRLGALLALLYPAATTEGAELAQQRELSFDEVEAAVLNVARYDVFKLSEAVLAGNVARVQRMLDGLQAEGEATVLVHWTLSEDIRALARLRSLMDDGKPLPMALQEARVWGLKQKLFERILPRLSSVDAANLLHAAHQVDGIVKGLKQPGWPVDAWMALHQLAMMVCKAVA